MTIKQLIEQSEKSNREMQRLLADAGKISERIYQLSINRKKGIRGEK